MNGIPRKLLISNKSERIQVLCRGRQRVCAWRMIKLKIKTWHVNFSEGQGKLRSGNCPFKSKIRVKYCLKCMCSVNFSKFRVWKHLLPPSPPPPQLGYPLCKMQTTYRISQLLYGNIAYAFCLYNKVRQKNKMQRQRQLFGLWTSRNKKLTVATVMAHLRNFLASIFPVS